MSSVCACTTNFDMRVRCLPENGEAFKRCRARIDTAVWLLNNDVDLYNAMEKCATPKASHDLLVERIKKMGIILWKDISNIITLYTEDEDNIILCEECGNYLDKMYFEIDMDMCIDCAVDYEEKEHIKAGGCGKIGCYCREYR